MSLGGFGLNPFSDIKQAASDIVGATNSQPANQPFSANSPAFSGPAQKVAQPILGSAANQAGGAYPDSGSVLGASTINSTPAASPYSTGQQSILDSLPGQIGNISNTAGIAATQNAGDYSQKIQDFLAQQGLVQSGIDTQGQQNELSRIQGSRGVLDMIGQGIKSGGVQLANANAGSSSATEALARAYGILGRTQQSGVNNQYQQGVASIANSQHAADVGRNTGVADLQQSKQDMIGNIVQNANYQLGYLNQQLANASLPDRIDIQGQIDAIKQNATAALSQYDPTLSNGVAGINPASVDQNRTAAQQLSIAGAVPDTQFNFTSAIPTQFQGSGPFSSDLPVFATPNSKKVTA